MKQNNDPNNLNPQAIVSQELAAKASAHMHSTDYCAHMMGIEVAAVSSGYAELNMTVRPEFANGYGVCQGGLIATLADTAFAHACNSANKKTVAQGFSIDFVRPANIGDELCAIAKEQSRGKLTGLYQVKVSNQLDKLVAILNGNSFELGGPVVE